MRTWHQSAAGAFIAVFVASGVVHAQVPVDVEAMHREGMALRDQHRDREALGVFRRIYEQTHEPRALARMGLAEGALGLWTSANEHLRGALGSLADPWIAANRAPLQAALDEIQTHLGDLVVSCDTPGAEVWIQGERVATLPHPQALRAAVGSRTVEVRAPGHVTETRTVEVPASGTAQLSVTLRPVASSVPVTPVTAETATTTMPLRTEDTSNGSALRTLAWTTAVGGTLFLVAGAAAFAIGSAAAANWNNDAICTAAGGGTRMTQCGSSESTESATAVIAPIGLVGGGIMAVSSIVFFAVSSGSHSAEHAAAGSPWSCGAGPGSVGLACGVTF